MVFQCINISQVPKEVFSIPPWDLANVNAWKPMFDPYITTRFCVQIATFVANSNDVLIWIFTVTSDLSYWKFM